MDVLHKTEVTPDQIDHLGHMNVRFYGEHARAGADRLLDSLGLRPDGSHDLIPRDTYVRHHHEQLVGAPLEVRGGVLDAAGDRIRLYEELVNADSDDIAATFVLTFEQVDPATRAAVPIDGARVATARAGAVEIPDHGRPRSIALDDDVTTHAPSLEVANERRLGLRQPRTIGPDECDERGFVRAENIPELTWGGEALPGREFHPIEPTAGGGQMGFATMETRATWIRFPRIGDQVQSFGAELSIASKTMLTRNWVLDVERGDVVAVFTIVSLAFDMAARRAMVIPDDSRQRLTRRLQPDLA